MPLRKKQGMQNLAAAFTDHLAVCLRLSVVEPIMRRGNGYWKLEDKTVIEQFKILWDQLKRQKNVFPIPRYGGRDPESGGYKVSFAKYRRTAGEHLRKTTTAGP